jgi:uncharacterized protein YbjT (DUF2867 family)
VILVTGAGGKTGRVVIQALLASGEAVRALVHRPEQIDGLKEIGAKEVRVGDMHLGSTMESACQDIRAVYHICPNVNPNEVAIGQNIIRAARLARVEHVVYHSLLHPQTEAMPHHWLKMRVEELLFESGLDYTILQPCAYMQNVLTYWQRIVSDGIYPVPYPVETRLSMVDLVDVAAAAAITLTKPGHAGAIYELAGPEVLSQTEVAQVLGQQLGRPVYLDVVPLEEWEKQARASGMDDYVIETLIKMFRYYANHGLWGNPNVLGWLLGYPPHTFEDFVLRTINERPSDSKRFNK